MALVPQTRLLFWFAVIVLPFSALGALYPAAATFAIVLIAALCILALADAALAFGKLDGVSLKLPDVVRFSKARAGVIELSVGNKQRKPLRLRLGLALPWELESIGEDTTVVLPEGTEWSRVDWTCIPRQRGKYRLRRAHLETASRLGFWAVRRAFPVQCEVRVYPNLLGERGNLAALFLNRGAFGIHAQRQIGKGRDFEKLREYIPGDSYDEIHWKATAKRGHPVTKIFQIERTQEVYVVIDASRLSARGVGGGARHSVPGVPPSANPDPARGPLNAEDWILNTETVLERFITSALILAQAAEKQGDLFGLLTFTDKVETFLRAKNGKEHYSTCRDALYTLAAQRITPDFDEIASFIRTRLRRRALLIFLTSLDDPVLAESFARNAALLAGQHLVLANMIQPPGAEPLFTRGDVSGIDDIYRHLGGHLQWHNLMELKKGLQRRGVSLSLLAEEKLATDLVSQYVGVKQRQLI